jgi:hypothetical protein
VRLGTEAEKADFLKDPKTNFSIAKLLKHKPPRVRAWQIK